MTTSYAARMMPDVVIVIVTYNSACVISGLLDSIPAAADGISYEIVVVDNGSTDGTLEILAARSECHVVYSVNNGYAGGINRGVRAGTSAEAILILNPDVRLHEKSVRPLVAALKDSPTRGSSCRRSAPPRGPWTPRLRREPTPLRGTRA